MPGWALTGSGGTGATALGVIGKFSCYSGDTDNPTALFLVDDGAGGGATDGFNWPYATSARTITRLRLTAPQGTQSNPPTATLYKNGVATAMTISLPSGAAAGATVVDDAHSIDFVDGDLFAIFLEQAAGGESQLPYTVVIEGPAGGGGGGGGGTATQIAAWALGFDNRRFYAVSPNGSDSNAGYGATAAEAGARAKLTFTGLAAVVPKVGAGRTIEIIAENGTYADSIDTVLDGMVGYAADSIVRATCTNATADSVAFAGDEADFITAGFVTTTGMFAAGYNTVAAAPRVFNDVSTGTDLQLAKVGGGAPGFPDAGDPSLPTGWRLRFDSNTTTAALRNRSFPVWRVATDVITVDDDISPVSSDVCYLEMAGVVVPTLVVGKNSCAFNLIGYRSSGTAYVDCAGGAWLLVGCGSASRFDLANGTVAARKEYLHPTYNVVQIGAAIRSETILETGGCAASLFNCSTKTDFVITQAISHEDAGSTIGRRMFYRGSIPLTSQTHTHQVVGNGGAAHGAGAPTRFIAADSDQMSLELNSAPITLDGVFFEDGSAGGIVLSGTMNVYIGPFGITGSVVSPGAICFRQSVGSLVQVYDPDALVGAFEGTKNSIEMNGAPGLAGWAYAPWSTITNLVFGCLKDVAGNRIVGAPPAASHITTGYSYCNAELIGRVVALKNGTGSAVPQWSIVTEDTPQNIFLAKADTLGDCKGMMMIMLTPAENGDWALCALEATRAPAIFDAVPTLAATVYVSTANFGQVQTAVPAAAGTNQKRRIGHVVLNSSAVQTALNFNPEIMPTTADGNP